MSQPRLCLFAIGVLVILLLGSIASAAGQQTIFFTTADGNVFYNGNVDTGAYVATNGGDLRGDVHFAAFNASSHSQIQLVLNPYGLPFFGPNVTIYGIDHASSGLAGSDYGGGILIGSYVLPSNPHYGQLIFFDVTNFVQTVSGPYFALVIRSDGADVFSSTRYNLGTPPELVATPVPEPSTFALAALGAITLYLTRRVAAQQGHVNGTGLNGMKLRE